MPPDNHSTCECGNPSPCSLHDVTDTMHEAFALLGALDHEQRSRILCWYCRTCGKYVPPGASCCPQGPCPDCADLQAENARLRVVVLRASCMDDESDRRLVKRAAIAALKGTPDGK